MKKFIFFILFLGCVSFVCSRLFAEDNQRENDPSPATCVLPKNCLLPEPESLFSIGSEDLDPAESLNRIAGGYDRGYAKQNFTYKSKSHERSDPLHERSYDEVSN